MVGGLFCKGICSRWPRLKSSQGTRYALGQKRCRHCDVWVVSDKPRCECCGLPLRARRKDKTNVRPVPAGGREQ